MMVSQVTDQFGGSFAHSMCRVEEKKEKEEDGEKGGLYSRKFRVFRKRKFPSGPQPQAGSLVPRHQNLNLP